MILKFGGEQKHRGHRGQLGKLPGNPRQHWVCVSPYGPGTNRGHRGQVEKREKEKVFPFSLYKSLFPLGNVGFFVPGHTFMTLLPAFGLACFIGGGSVAGRIGLYGLLQSAPETFVACCAAPASVSTWISMEQ